MNIYLISGEPSGDLYGARIIRALKQENKKIQFRFVGGQQMEREEPQGLYQRFESVSVMGYSDVIKNINTIRKFIRDLKKDIENFKADKIVYIDFPGMNLKIAKWAKSKNFENVHFVCPKIWAWKKYRHKAIKRDIDTMINILPFEQSFLSQLGIKSHYYGHPLTEVLSNCKWSIKRMQKGQIALLPGSRLSELKYILPVLNQLIKRNENLEFVVSKMPNIPIETYAKYLDLNSKNLTIQEGAYVMLQNAEIAIVTSGTASLEAAIIGIPQIVIYKADAFSFFIAKQLVNLRYISLPNLIMDKAVVTELLQKDCTVQNIENKINALQSNKKASILKDYEQLRYILSSKNIFQKIAQRILERPTSS